MKIKKIKTNLAQFKGTAHLYEVCGGEGPSHLVVSAAIVGGEPEVLLFAADGGGNILDWLELSGSQSGTLDINLVLAQAGYEVE